MKPTTSTGGNFDWVAPFYDALAFVVFGRRLQRAQAYFLDHIPADSTLLLVGGGTGWLLQQVLTSCQPKRVVYLEASARMVARASKGMIKGNYAGEVEFRVGTEAMLTNELFDVIITPFVLDLFAEETLRSHFIPSLKTVLKPGGLWLVTDFINTKPVWQRALLWVMIGFFRLTADIQVQRLANWQQRLTDAGLVCQQKRHQVMGMVSTEVWRG